MTKEQNQELSIVHVRLVNGDEVIGALANKTETSIWISDPLVVDQVTSDDGKTRIVLNNYIPFSAEKLCEFIGPHIISITNLHPEVIRYYTLSLKMSEHYDNMMLKEIKNNNESINDYLTTSTIFDDDLDEEQDDNLVNYQLSSNTIH